VYNVGASISLIAVGAILWLAVAIEIQGIDIQMIGVILLILGILYLVLSLLFWSDFSPYRRSRDRVVEERRDVR
jgi:hypothetical protein